MITNKEMNRHDKNEKKIKLFKTKKYREAKAIHKLKHSLPKELSSFFVFGAIEKQILVFYFSHPSLIAEFNARKEEIKTSMRKIYVENSLKEVIYFVDIKPMIVHRPFKKEVVADVVADRATGEFEIKATDDEISNKFKSIQKNIKECNNV